MKLVQLLCAPDGSPSASKLGTLLFGLTFTAKMLYDLPDDPWLWFVYGATVGGVDVAKKYLNVRFGAQQSPDLPPSKTIGASP